MPRQAREDLDLLAPALRLRNLLKPRVERVELTLDAIEVDQQLLKRELSERVIQALCVDPAAVLEREAGLAVVGACRRPVVDPAAA